MKNKIGALQIGIILLTLATAGIHFSLLFPDLMFILNGLGYLAILAAYFLPLPIAKDNRNLVRWVFMGYTAVTIIAWIAIGSRTPLAYIDKAIEVLLIVLIYMDRSQTE